MNLVSFHTCELFQNRGVASVSYVLRVRFAATERSAITPHGAELERKR